MKNLTVSFFLVFSAVLLTGCEQATRATEKFIGPSREFNRAIAVEMINKSFYESKERWSSVHHFGPPAETLAGFVPNSVVINFVKEESDKNKMTVNFSFESNVRTYLHYHSRRRMEAEAYFIFTDVGWIIKSVMIMRAENI